MILKAVLIYCVILACLYVFQRKLMYYPVRSLLEPAAYGVEAKVIPLQTADGMKIEGWFMPAADGMPVILHMHGNAGNLSDRREVYNAYHAAGFGVFALEWRGYGRNEGSPSEEGFYHDGRAAISWLKQQDIEESQIILYGESIGTGTATQMAIEIKPKALVLEAPFTSLWERAGEIYWWVLPARYMVKDRYESKSKIGKVEAPVLIFHNSGDRIVPAHHGKALYELANQPKFIEIVESAEHVMFDRDWIAQKMIEKLHSL